MHIKVFKSKICDFPQKITKYSKLCNKIVVFEIHVLWIEFVSDQNFSVQFVNKYANAKSSELW